MYSQNTALLHLTPVSNNENCVCVNIPNVANLGLISSTGQSINLKCQIPENSGEAIITDTDSSLWLNYSSIVSSTDNKRSISAMISSGTLPDGLSLKVSASEDHGNGDGKIGTAVSNAVSLSKYNQIVVDNIGSGYTDNGANKGHQIFFSLMYDPSLNDYKKLRSDINTSVTVSFTFTDI